MDSVAIGTNPKLLSISTVREKQHFDKSMLDSVFANRSQRPAANDLREETTSRV